MTVALDRNKNASESEVGYKKVRKYLIPNDWDLIKLGDMSTKVGSGKTPRGGEAVYQNSGIPFIRSQNVLNNRLELNGISYISDSIHNEMKSTKVIPNDVLLNITGASIGRCCIVPDSFNEGNLNQHVCIIRTKDTLDRNYLVNILLSPIGQNQIMNNQAGGNREGLNFEQIRKFDIPLPPLKEQQKIASILSTWDKAIELKEKLIEQKKELKKGLMQKLLTGEVRLPGFEGEWKEVKLAKVSKRIKGKAVEYLEDGKFPAIDMDYLESGLFKNFSNDATVFAKKQDVLLLWDGSRAGMAFTGVKGAVGSTFVKLECKSIHNIFLQKHLEMNERKIQRLREGSGIPHVPKDFLNFYKIKMPSMDEQQAISNVLNNMDKDLEFLQKEIVYIKQQKQGLMQQLLTGKVRVKV
ncbi:restriction endonuclease subunit S [Heyndrickxia sporothermodurans]|uniref:restriction endonuclease subunit S n=1 Tax=Heyndrickxia sporothermodurans TaxID=46224 RepID=UPI002E216F2A|nr:restriction endonuclease subunit S [Heyndrickxia sporothermodurans]MED3649511.1 restriction endonuclease subunit S [Heyndrickxia sporothermodurans]MED3698716.1 restriction endonuclease subunit S [Heyndrickxia sporothermodurans]